MDREKYTYVIVERNEQVATIWLNRPEVHNAFNQQVISELISIADDLAADNNCKVIVIRGKGTSFSAGADLQWMKTMGESSYEDNLTDSRQMALCFYKWFSIPKPVISVVHGSAIGGGVGLAAVSDITICRKNTRFAFSEVKVGLVPAVIAPYVVQRIGSTKAKELMLSGKEFDEIIAESVGLVSIVVEENDLDNVLQNYSNEYLKNSPNAMSATKNLVNKIAGFTEFSELLEYTASVIANARKSPDGQEGTKAFLEKRKPAWVK